MRRSKGDHGGTVTLDTVRCIVLTLPGVEEGTSFGTPAFRVGGRLMARLLADGISLMIKIEFDERDMLLEADPTAFYVTDHYRVYPAMLVRLDMVDTDTLTDLLDRCWRATAPKRLVKVRGARYGA